MGQRLPVSIGRHSHPQARPEAAAAPAPTGIDYLGLLAERRDAELARVHQLRPAGPRRLRAVPTRPTPPAHRRRRGDRAVTIDRLRAHWGFTRMPFAKDLAPSMLHTHRSHAEAVARITWCIDEQAMGVVTGEVGSGKTVAVRAALAGIDASRHTVIYLGNPTVGARGLYSTIVSALGGIPRFHRASLIPQAQEALATEEHERGRRVVLVLDEAHLLDADQLEGLRLLTNAEMDSHAALRLPARRPAHAAPADPPRCLRRPRPARRPALLDDRDGTRPRRPTTSPTTSSSPGAPTPCSPTTPSPSSTRCRGDCPGRSTTWPSSPWSPPSPNPRRSSTSPRPGPPSPR